MLNLIEVLIDLLAQALQNPDPHCKACRFYFNSLPNAVKELVHFLKYILLGYIQIGYSFHFGSSQRVAR